MIDGLWAFHITPNTHDYLSLMSRVVGIWIRTMAWLKNIAKENGNNNNSVEKNTQKPAEKLNVAPVWLKALCD
jgi:hypothetical protein